MGCMIWKQSKQWVRQNKSSAKGWGFLLLERTKEWRTIMFSDICAPFSVLPFTGSRYFVKFKQEYSQYITYVSIKSKSAVYYELEIYQAWLERKFGFKINTMHTHEW